MFLAIVHAASSSKFDDDDEGFPHNKTINAKAEMQKQCV